MAKKRTVTSKDASARGKPPTVFVHSSWRTSSTWLWACFRRARATLAYYEVFNGILSGIDREQITNVGPMGWQSGHPAGAPYFLEYLPLLAPQGGIVKYQDTMAFKSFIPASGLGGDLSEGEIEYVKLLIDHARRLGKQPVLTETRTLGRLSSLKKRFGGFHIFLYRNLLHQWASYSSQAYSGNPYFLQTIKDIIEHNQHDPFLKDLQRLHPLGPPDCRSGNYFMAFLLLHLYLYTHAFAYASISVDATRLARDPVYLKKMRRKIRERTSNDLDLETVRSNFEFCLSAPTNLDELRDNLVAAMQSIQAVQKAGWREIGQTNALIDDLIVEMEHHKFYAAGLTSVVCRPGGLLDIRGERDGLAAERDSLVTERGTLLQERDGLAAERDAFRSERYSLAVERGTLIQERDGLAAERDAFRSERDSLLDQHNASMQDRDGLAAERDAFRSERDGLAAERDAFRSERDSLATERDSLVDQRNALMQEHNALMQERDGLGAERDAFRSERDGLATERDTLRAERDNLADQRNALLQERDGLAAQREDLAVERDTLTQELDGLAADRSAFQSERERLLGEQNCQRQECDALTAQRDALLQERDNLAAEQDILREDRDAASSQRDALVQEHIGVAAERDRLRSERDALMVERDALTRAHQELVHEQALLRSERDSLIEERALSSRQLVPVGTVQAAKSKGPRSIFFWKRADS